MANVVVGYENAFRQHADSFLNKPLSVLYNENVPGLWALEDVLRLEGGVKETVLLHRLSLHPWYGTKVRCVWAVKSIGPDDIIQSWRYVSKPDQCLRQKYYAGLW
jgi:hypothetical protein